MHQTTLRTCFKKVIFFVLLILFCGLGNSLLAQKTEKDEHLYIEVKGGKSYFGTIVKKDEDQIIIEDRKQVWIPLFKDQIRSISMVDSSRLRGNKYWPVQPQSIFQNATPNAFSPKEGEVHLLNAYVFFNQVNVGLTDRLSMTAGTGLLGFFPDTPSFVWLAPKYTLRPITKNIRLGFAAYIIANFQDRSNANTDILGSPIAVLTFGKPDLNFSIGYGAVFDTDGWVDESIRTFNASARIGKRTYLRTENYIFVYDDGEIDFTATFVGLKNIWPKLSIDYGLIMSIEPGYGTFVIPAPFFTMTYSFSKTPSNLHLVK